MLELTVCAMLRLAIVPKTEMSELSEYVFGMGLFLLRRRCIMIAERDRVEIAIPRSSCAQVCLILECAVHVLRLDGADGVVRDALV